MGTFLQIFLKLRSIGKYWNNFTSSFLLLIGNFFPSSEKLFFTGFFTFLLLVSGISLLYEIFSPKVTNKILSGVFQFLYSTLVLSSFPVMYFLFMKNKLDINLIEFFQDENHLMVFSGYFVFYLLLLLNKQLLALQTLNLPVFPDVYHFI